MSNESRFVSESLEALLISIADGVREAQDVLSSSPAVDVFGRPMPTYHLPHLDFKIEVNMETVAREGVNRGPLLRIQKRSQDASSTRDVGSVLSGRLVAIPPREGLPSLILTIRSKKEKDRSHTITIAAANSAGEILVGQAIELNINREASKQLSAVAGVKLGNLRAGTSLKEVILITNEDGIAQTRFTIDSKVPARSVLVLTAELGYESASLSVSVGGRR